MFKVLLSLVVALVLALPAREGIAQCTPAAVPYYQNFGSGTLDASWYTASTYGPLTQRLRIRARGRIRVTDQFNPVTPAAHPYLLAMDAPMLPYPFVSNPSDVYNAALLCADMRGATGMYLYFHGAIYSAGDARRPLSVYLSDDNGASFSLMKRFDGNCPGGFFCPAVRVETWRSLDTAAGQAGLSLTGQWVIGFEHAADGALTEDGVVLDSVAISPNAGPAYEPIDLGDPREKVDRTVIDCPPWLPGCKPVPCDGIDCPYVLDFETRWIDPRVKLISVNGAATTLGKDERGYHLRLQALEGVSAHSVNVVSLRFDFSKQAPERPALSFSWQALDRASNDYDGVYLSDDGGASYVRVHALDRAEATPGEWRTEQLDLRALADKHGLRFSEAFVVAFAHYALKGQGRAGYALDDIHVGDPDGRAGKQATSDPASPPDRFALEGNYPNPFNPATTISFVLPEASPVTLAVYDVFGREVARLLDGQVVEAGAHEVAFEAGHLASGTYLYRLSAGRFSATRRMVLLK